MTNYDAVVIGAGPSGLAVAATLQQRGLRPLVLERRDGVGSSWRTHYDRLHLHTPRWLSGLPGLPIPKEFGTWVARDHVVRYLELYAAHHRLEVRTGAEVARVDRAPSGVGWVVALASGERVETTAVVVASGFNHTPRRPRFPGLDGFTGEVKHAKDYRSGRELTGRDVLVLGAGNTGTEIAVDLVEQGASRVRMAVRTPPHIQRRDRGPWVAQYGGIMLRRLPVAFGDAIADIVSRLTTPDLTDKGLPRPVEGLVTRVVRDNAIPVQDVGIIDAVSRGSVEVVAAIDSFDRDAVVLTDGSRITPEVVLLATGYSQGLEPVIGHLGVLDPAGRPLASGAACAPGADGMWFIGYTNPISGMLREIAIDARKIAKAVAAQARSRSAKRKAA